MTIIFNFCIHCVDTHSARSTIMLCWSHAAKHMLCCLHTPVRVCCTSWLMAQQDVAVLD